MKSPTVWITWLQVVLVLLLAYSLVLVFAGSIAGQLFTVLGFGPPESADTELVGDYLKLPFMVLGAVMAGWLWFVLDTGMSIVLGFPGHALFNVPFAG